MLHGEGEEDPDCLPGLKNHTVALNQSGETLLLFLPIRDGIVYLE